MCPRHEKIIFSMYLHTIFMHFDLYFPYSSSPPCAFSQNTVLLPYANASFHIHTFYIQCFPGTKYTCHKPFF